jgi:threonine dehydratase
MVTIEDVRAAAAGIAPYVRQTPLQRATCLKDEPEIVLFSDEDMREAARWLWFEMGLAADLSGAASIAALRTGNVRPGRGRRICALISGAGPDGLS